MSNRSIRYPDNVNMPPNTTRREVILGLAGLILAGPSVASRLLTPTPQQTTGPFYPSEPPLDDDNDLTRIRGRSGVAQGYITELTGRVLDVNGRSIQNVRIEIWQCDANGRYHHPGDRGGRAVDENFQGFGHTRTDAEGRYHFRTIQPVPYPGRTPHIHVAVLTADGPSLVTQLYIKGEPRNAHDFIFNRIPVERRHMVLADFVPVPGARARVSAQFDVVLAGANGTPRA